MPRARLISKVPLELIKGKDGRDGEKGAPGVPGLQGRPGKDAPLPLPIWEGTRLHWNIGGEVHKGPDLQGPQGERGPGGESRSGGGGGTPQTSKLYEVITATTDTGLGSNNNIVVLADATSGGITITLPKANKAKEFVYHVKKIDSSTNDVTIQPQNSELIDSEDCFIIERQNTNFMIVSNGTAWYVL